MGPEDALRALTLLEPKQVVPIHYNTFPPIKQDAHAWATLVRESTAVKPCVLEPGGWLDLSKSKGLSTWTALICARRPPNLTLPPKAGRD